MSYRPLEIEEEIRGFWDRNKIKEKLMNFREKNNIGLSGWVEGPPTLNGIPHVGHLRGRAMKDLRYRWKTMEGLFVPFWAGWDCQGLPVELEVEKTLGVKNKRELLEKVGEERFIEECKKVIIKYQKEWVEADKKLGLFIDHSKAYWTYLDSYIEREWQYLKRAWAQGLLEEGYYVVAYCPGCQTSLSNAEVGYEDSYREVEDPSLYFKFKLAGSKDEFFLVWTTMPFTLITDIMLAVHPEAEYARVRVGKEKWIVAVERVEAVMRELGIDRYKVIDTVSGKKLEGLKYDYPFKDIVPKQAELDSESSAHRVVLEDFVDVNTATGVVHLSPGNGEEDFFSAKKHGVPIFVPFDEEVKFTSGAGIFNGIFARDADSMVTEELRRRGLLVSVKTVKHEYPTCWRSHHKLVWLARREYFLRTDKLNDRIVEAADKVKYFFEAPRNRFLSFLKEGKPWCISRERVWGAPLPIWVCDECKGKTFVGNKKELIQNAVGKIGEDFELHKPWVDRVTLKCRKCGGTMHREPFVLDTWHNSGAAPYARFTTGEFSKYVPFDFLTEAMDQTRGWANSLLLEHVIMVGNAEAPYKAFLFQGLVQDEKGRKMSKSLGNVMEANEFLEKYSADVCRFYLLWKCSPVEFMNFDVQELRGRPYQVLSTLYHLNRFFVQNADYDNFDPQKNTLVWALKERQLSKPDLWVLSKLQEIVEKYTVRLERCEFNVALATLEDYVIDVISRLYVPMIRKELWTDDPETLNRRLTVYAVLWHVLKTVTLLFNPITPYLCEAMYQKVYRRLDQTLCESVNFESWPKASKKMRDERLEEKFGDLFRCVSLVYSARQSGKLKRRWPLSKVLVTAPEKVYESLRDLEEIFLELANVKAVGYTEEETKHTSSRNWISASEDDVEVFLNTYRGAELLGEGLMRDLARRIQSLRKELGYVPADILRSVHIAGLEGTSIEILKPYLKLMEELVRASNIHVHRSRKEVEAEWHRYSLDSEEIYVAIS